MVSVFVQKNGETTKTDRVEPEWLDPKSGATVWVDLSAPTPEEAKTMLAGTFHFHPLAVEDAVSAIQFPKIEAYPTYLYLILHGVDIKHGAKHLATRDVDFFLGPNYLVTVHDGHSRSIATLRDACDRNTRILSEGPVALLHRIVDQMVDNYRPAIEDVEKRIAALEEKAFLGQDNLVRQVLKLKRDLAETRRVLVPQRDAIGRLARREFPAISDEMSFRFRDVYDHVVRLTEESILFQDRVTGVLEVNLATVSNRLNQVMKVLTVLSTIFMPMTVLTGMWGMNVPLPHFPGGDAAQFWWIVGLMAAMVGGMLAMFRKLGWI